MTTTVTAAELGRDAQDFLRFKRAMGRGYLRAEFVLDGFVRFVALHWGDHGEAALDVVVLRCPIIESLASDTAVRGHTATAHVRGEVPDKRR